VKRLATVLCAVDIDQPGRQAFAQALALARAHAARMNIVCALPPCETFETETSDRLTYLLQLRAAAEAAGVEVRVDVQHGEVGATILQHARLRPPDLIVLSAAHGTSAKGLRVSSVVGQVLREGAYPTLVVCTEPKSLHARAFTNVVCAVDFSPSTSEAIARAMSLAAGRECRVTLLHVVPGPEGGSEYRTMRMHVSGYYDHVATAALERLQGLIPAGGEATVFARVTIGGVASEILRVTRASQADMIVVGTSRTLVRRRNGLTNQLLWEAPCPVLAVPASTRLIDEPDERRPAA
jgi:nucleotide-binding universal stress UspA family protein